MMKKHIFREYDIRGIYNEDFNESDAILIGMAFGTKVQELKDNTVVVGYDNRISSRSLEENLVRGLISTGVGVIRLGLVTTPMYFTALNKLNLTKGIMITASHNPKEYNGFKMSYNGINNTYGADVKEISEIIDKKAFKEGKGYIKNYRIQNEYIDTILNHIDLGQRKIKVVYDCGNGTTSIIADKIFNNLNIEAIPLFNISDPTFPNHHPDPCEEKNNALLKEKVLECKADIGIGFDGDGDRVGVVDEKGNFIETDKVMIVIWRYLFDKVQNKKALFDIKCSKSLKDELDKLNIEYICSRTGASYTKKITYEEDCAFGGEYSGHMYFRDRFNGHDDGIYNGLRLVEILSKTDKSFSELLEGINKYYNTPTIYYDVKEEYKNKMITDIIDYCIIKNYNYDTIDGVKIIFDDGTAIIRASNTSPKLTYRYEATTKEKLNEIEGEFNRLLDNFKNKYESINK